MRLYLNENAASMENNIVYYEKLKEIFDFILIKDVLSYGNCVRKEEEKEEESIINYVNATSISHRRRRA